MFMSLICRIVSEAMTAAHLGEPTGQLIAVRDRTLCEHARACWTAGRVVSWNKGNCSARGHR